MTLIPVEPATGDATANDRLDQQHDATGTFTAVTPISVTVPATQTGRLASILLGNLSDTSRRSTDGRWYSTNDH